MTSYFHYDLHSLRLFIVVAELGSLTRLLTADSERSTGCDPIQKTDTPHSNI